MQFPRGPVSRIFSLEPELFTVGLSRRPSRVARAQNNNFQINSGRIPPVPRYTRMYSYFSTNDKGEIWF
jgi:hypothetical protein